MKAIQSFWSKPFLDKKRNQNYERSFGGFKDKKSFYTSWAVSVLNLRSHFDEVVLVTDRYGKELLIDELQLPYTACVVTLDDLNGYDSGLWALGKIYAYQIQKEPFFHLDGDAFIWKPLAGEILQAPLFCQHLEKFDSIQYFFRELIMKLDFIAPEIHPYAHDFKKANTMINAGIIGGNDMDFFKRYTEKAFELVDKNLHCLDRINQGLFNCIFEQCLFTSLAKIENKQVSTFVASPKTQDFSELLQFNLIPHRVGFTHLIGHHKQNPIYTEQLSMQLKYRYPDYFDRINNLVNIN